MADWYAVAGTSGGSGTLLDPWQTEADIVWTNLDPGDTLWLQGTFTETFASSRSGTSKDIPITIDGMLGESKAIIDCENVREHGVTNILGDYTKWRNLDVRNAEATPDPQAGSGTCVLIDRSDGVVLENIDTSGAYWDGIFIYDSNNCDVKSCTAIDNKIRGIIFATRPPTLGAISAGTCTDCTMTGNGRRGYTVSASDENWDDIKNVVCKRATITGNGEGVEFEYCVNCEISDSVISENTLEGLDPFGDEDGKGIGIQLAQDVHIINNTIQNNRVYGVYSNATGPLPSSFHLLGNIITGNIGDGAIYMHNTSHSLARIIGNYLSAPTALTTNWILLARECSSQLSFMNNVCVEGIAGWRQGSAVTTGICKNNIFIDQTDIGTNTGYTIFQNLGGNTVDIDNNVYWRTDEGQTKMKIDNADKDTNAEILTIDSNAIFEDPGLDSNYKPTNPNLIATGVYDSSVVPGVDINGEPFPSIDLDIGAVQGTDAANHPFHPLNL